MEKFVLTAGVCAFFCLYGFTAVNANQSEIPDEAPCEAGWDKIHRGCYMFVETDMSWEDAASHCKEQHGELTSIQSWKEKEELHKYLTANKANVLKWWVGLHRLLPSGEDWKWQSDDPLDANLINWVNPSLKSRPGKFCGMLELAPNKFQVSVSRCSTEQPFICEYHSIIQRQRDEVIESTIVNIIQEEATTTQPSTSSHQQMTEKCVCKEPKDDEASSESSESSENRLRRQNEALNTNEELYQRYLQSEIDANKAKIVYYSEVTKLYQEALEAQRQYYSSYQEKTNLEIKKLQDGATCD